MRCLRSASRDCLSWAWLLWITVVTGFGGVGLWAIFVLPGEIAKRFG